MKRVHKVVKAILLSMIGLAGFFSCTHVYPTTEIDSFDVTAEAYHGVNILTWDAVKDAASYSVYRTTDGQREQVLSQYQNNNFYIDTEIAQGTEYEYRVLAHPVNTTMHDSSEEEVDVETAETWPPVNTSFLDLAQYDDEYDLWGETLSEWSISAELLADGTPNVRVKFPVKPYARYTVKIGPKDASSFSDLWGQQMEWGYIDEQTVINGFDYTDTATVDIKAVFPGEKEITIIAEPFSPRYKSSTVKAYSTVTINDISGLNNAVDGEIYTTWTNYNSGIATARVRFSPATMNGFVFDTSNYTVYRLIHNSKGTWNSTAGRNEYASITELGSPRTSGDASSFDTSNLSKTVYYYDDSIDISAAADVKDVVYIVVLNYEGKIKTAISSPLYAPGNWNDNNWNYNPETNSAYIQNLTLDKNGYLTVDVWTSYPEASKFTYGHFSTINEAKTAVESELPHEIALKYHDDFYTSYGYNYSGKSADTLTYTSGYYAFRFVSKVAPETDVARTVIASVEYNYSNYDNVYFFNIQYGAENINGYYGDGNGTPYISSVSNGSDTSSITVSYNASYSAAARYNIYRMTSSDLDFSYSYDLWNYTLIDTIDSTSFTSDYQTYSEKVTSPGYYVYYAIQPIPRYSAPSSNNYSRDYTYVLSSPYLYSYSNELDWASVDKANEYYIYRATSYAELSEKNSGYYDYWRSTYSNTYTVPTESTTYYYAVRAYNSSYGYSALSNIVTVYP